MAPLARFSPPGNLPEPTDEDRNAWSQKIVDLIAPFVEELPAFYDPTAEDTPPDATRRSSGPPFQRRSSRVGSPRPSAGSSQTALAKCRTSTASGASNATTPTR
jgi:hypothetical protein